ncbi:MAG: helix-turn-helix domain-containing protein [Burkholderiales bacterium]|nr:helix-turn-helix domain-containing protein [Burkholderiales bacterium]
MSTVISDLGGPTAVARMLGIKPPSVIGWGGRPPADRCPSIERATDGRVTVEQLRPDVRWVRVADPSWPHPAGRPCLDVAAPKEVARDAA